MSDTKTKIFHKIFLFASAIVILYGVFITVTYGGFVDFLSLMYFSIISNLLMAVAFIARLVLYNKKSVIAQYLLSSALFSVSITVLTYNFVLVPFGSAATIFSDIGNFIIHFLVVILALVNHFCLEEKSEFTFRHILVGMFLPIVYWLFFVSFGGAIGFHPYFFVNPQLLSWITTFAWFGMMLIGFVLLALCLFLIGKYGRRSQAVAMTFCLLLSSSFIFVSCTIPADTPTSIETNDLGIPEEGLRFTAGISLSINLEGNSVEIRTHEHDDILITASLSSHAVYKHPIYVFDENYSHLIITDEERGRPRIGKNSSNPHGTVNIFVPESLSADEVFSFLGISAGYIRNTTFIVID